MRILLVEDDEDVARAVEGALVSEGHAVTRAADGRFALTAARTEPWDAILLDLGLPCVDGMRVLRTLRSESVSTPVLILTARDALESRLSGLDAGADDYLVKPFHTSELLARLRAVMRRHGGGQSHPTNGVVTLMPEKQEAQLADGSRVRLSKRESALLEALLAKPGTIVSRRQLEARIYEDEVPESNALEYIIHALRKKLGPEVVENVRGLGWRVARGPEAGGSGGAG